MIQIPAQYAAWPAQANLKQDYSACYPIPAFTHHGVAYVGTEAQPEFSPAQLDEIARAGGYVFDTAPDFLDWRDAPEL